MRKVVIFLLLTATVALAHSVDLTWTQSPSPGVVSNRVYRDGIALVTIPANTKYTDADVAIAGCSTHSYQVTAVDSGSAESAKSNTAVVIFPPDTGSVCPPTGLTVTNVK